MRKQSIIVLVLCLISTLLLKHAPVQAEYPKSTKNLLSQSSTSTNKLTTNSTLIETKYLIKLKKNADYTKFIESKKLKIKKPKRLKLLNLLSIKLNPAEYALLKKDSLVEYIELDSNVSALDLSDNDTQSIPWGIKDVGTLPALEKGYKGQGINIAILDTGIAAHEDLAIKGGVSFVEGNTSFADDQGHGTHVAGTIGALNNKLGVLGVAPEANIYSVKVLDQKGTGSYSQIIEGITWCIENKMNIISMSLGGNTNSQALHDVINTAKEQGIILIAAAGNAGQGVETEAYPARYSEVVSVGAIDSLHERADFSSTGSELDLMAPGKNILSTTIDGKYGFMSGTSMAAPHVAGIAAALWSSNPQLKSSEVVDKLITTAIPSGNSHDYGKGIVSLAKALGLSQELPDDSVNVNQQTIEKFETEFDKDLKRLSELKRIALERNNLNYAKDIDNIYNQVTIQQNDIYLPYEEYLNKLSSLKNENLTTYNNEYYEANLQKFSKLENYVNEKIQIFADLLNIQVGSLTIETGILTDPLIINQAINVDIPAGNSQVFTFIPNRTGNFKIFTGPFNGTGSVNDTFLEIYSDVGLTNRIAFNDDSNGNVFSEIKISLTANVTYYVKLRHYDSSTSVHASLSVMDDDQIVKEVTLNTPVDINEVSGKKAYVVFNVPKKGFYKFSTGYFGAVTTSGNNDTILYAYSDNQFTKQLAYNDDSNGTLFSEIKLNLNEGTKIYFKLNEYSNGAIYTRFSVTEIQPQFNSLIVKTPINLNVGENQFAAFTFTPTKSGLYRFNTGLYNSTGIPNDTVLSLYEDSNMTIKLAENDDYKVGTSLSMINYRLIAGKTYYIQLNGYANQSISTQMNVNIGNQYYYDIDGKLDYIILFDGKTLDYVYDENGNLIRKIIIQ